MLFFLSGTNLLRNNMEGNKTLLELAFEQYSGRVFERIHRALHEQNRHNIKLSEVPIADHNKDVIYHFNWGISREGSPYWCAILFSYDNADQFLPHIYIDVDGFDLTKNITA